MDYESILYEVERGRARITLNRPDKRNALSAPLLDEFERTPRMSTYLVAQH